MAADYEGISGPPTSELVPENIGKTWRRGTASEGAGVLYVMKVVDASTGEIGWHELVTNAG